MTDLSNVPIGNACGVAAVAIVIAVLAHQSNGDADSSTNWLADNAPWFDDVIQALYSNPITATIVTSLVAGGTVALIFALCDFGRKRWFGDSGRGKRKPAMSR